MLTFSCFPEGTWYPKGTNFIMFPFYTHRHPDYFSDPDKFIPERFLDIDGSNPYIYTPFSAGPRNCIGKWSVFLINGHIIYQLTKIIVVNVIYSVLINNPSVVPQGSALEPVLFRVFRINDFNKPGKLSFFLKIQRLGWMIKKLFCESKHFFTFFILRSKICDAGDEMYTFQNTEKLWIIAYTSRSAVDISTRDNISTKKWNQDSNKTTNWLRRLFENCFLVFNK